MKPFTNLTVALAYAATCLIWSSTWLMIKVGLEGAPPMTSLGARFLIATLLIVAIVTARGLSLPRSRHFIGLGVFLGVFQMALPYSLVYWGEQFISSGLTAVLASTMPIGVAILARGLLGDRLTVAKVLGILVGIGGVWVIFSDSVSFGGRESLRGMVAVIVGIFFAGLSSIFIKKHSGRYDPFASLVLPFLVGTVLVWSYALGVERSNPMTYDSLTWLSILYLALLGTVAAFSLYFWTMRYVDVTVMSYQTFVIPVLAVLLGWLLLDEPVTYRLLVGTGLILAGIALATLRRR